MNRILRFASIVGLLAAPALAIAPPALLPAPGAPVSRPVAERARVQLSQLPLSFEPNQGQNDPAVKFVSRGDGYALFLTSDEAVFKLGGTAKKPAVLRMKLLGANPATPVSGAAPQPGVVSYLSGNDEKRWHPAIPTYGKVSYPRIYPGVDLVFYGNQSQLEYDFVVTPGADATQIVWQIDGAAASLDSDGDLLLTFVGGLLTFKRPVLYQREGEARTAVDGSFAVAGNQVRFKLGPYDHSKALIIDPVLSYATYLAGSNSDIIGTPTGPGIAQAGVSQGIAVDSSGSVYVVGSTMSLDFPTRNAIDAAPPAKIVAPGQWYSPFVSKFSPDGSSLVYSTYLGGNGADRGYAIAVDSSGSAYITGLTTSPNFPISQGAYQTVCAPIANNTGISVAQSNCNSFDYNVFVTKLTPAGTGIAYSTFLGGYGNWGYGTAIAVDGSGRAYVAGNEDTMCNTTLNYTFPSCFPTTSNAIHSGTSPGGHSPQYAFVAVFNPTGTQLLYSTLFGGSDDKCDNGCGGNYATGIAVDSNGYFYLIGQSQDGGLPTTPGVIQTTAGPGYASGSGLQSWRGFVAKFTPVTGSGGPTLAYATYLGGQAASVSDFISGIAIDSASNAYLVGYTNSKDFPVTTGAFNTVCGINGTCAAAHVTKINSTATSILWSTYVGGGRADGNDALYFTGPIQLDSGGNIWFQAQAGSAFPLINPTEPAANGGSMEVAVAELDPTGSKLLFFTRIGSGGRDTGDPAGLVIDPANNVYVAGNNIGPNLITTPGAFERTVPNNTCCYKGFVAKIAADVIPADLSAQAASVTASGEAGSIQVTAAAGVDWAANSNAPWITVTSGASGDGSGAVGFSVAANPGAARMGTITIAGQAFTIAQEGPPAAELNFAGSLAQIASAGGWDTTLTLVNLDNASNEARLNTYAGDGSTPLLPYTFPQTPAAGATLAATFDETLAANSMLVFDTTGPADQTSVVGSAQLLASGNVGGFGIFEIQSTGQQAVVPLETRNAPSYLLAFDETGGLNTGLALANVGASAGDVKVIVRDDSGAVIPAKVSSIHLDLNGHASFMLNDTAQGFPEIAGKRGTVEFDTPSGGRISVLGLRAHGTAITTLPVLAQAGTTGGAFAHAVTGAGWETLFTLVNTGTSAASLTLSFFDEKTGAPLPLTFVLPQTSTSPQTASSLTQQSLAPGATLLVQTQGGASNITGSAQLTTTGNVSGFAIFQIQASGQEAVVPLETRTPGTFVLAYDNTNGLATGVALANVASTAASVPATVYDDNGATLTARTITLTAKGHTSFMLTDSTHGFPVTAGKRGTVEFQTPSGGRISALGIRAVTATNVITTIPVLAK